MWHPFLVVTELFANSNIQWYRKNRVTCIIRLLKLSGKLVIANYPHWTQPVIAINVIDQRAASNSADRPKHFSAPLHPFTAFYIMGF